MNFIKQFFKEMEKVKKVLIPFLYLQVTVYLQPVEKNI